MALLRAVLRLTEAGGPWALVVMVQEPWPGSLGDGGSFVLPYFYPRFPPPYLLCPALAHVPLAPLVLLTLGASLRNPPNR